MKYFVLNVVHGFGPIIRLLELGEQLNIELARRGDDIYSFVIPDLGEGQNSVVADVFGHSEFIQHILVDPIFGEHLSKIAYRGNDHREFLRNMANTQPNCQNEITNHFTKEFTAYEFRDRNKQTKIEPSECYELARNPFVRLPFPGFMYTFGYRSDIIKEMGMQNVERYDEKSIGKLLPILETAEEQREIDFVQNPPTIRPSMGRNFVYTPLHSMKKEPNNYSIEPGIYVSVTGIRGLREKVITNTKRVKLRLYCSPSASKEFPEAVPKSPDIVTNPNIRCVYARFGWGAITLALMAEKALITPPIDVKDDPEISLNKRLLVDELKLASVMDTRPVEEVLEEASERAKGISDFLSRLKEKYHIIEGPVYVAGVIADYLTK